MLSQNMEKEAKIAEPVAAHGHRGAVFFKTTEFIGPVPVSSVVGRRTMQPPSSVNRPVLIPSSGLSLGSTIRLGEEI